MKACHDSKAEPRHILERELNAPLSDDEILSLMSNAVAFPLSNEMQLRLIATARELRRYRRALDKMREAAKTLSVT